MAPKGKNADVQPTNDESFASALINKEFATAEECDKLIALRPNDLENLLLDITSHANPAEYVQTLLAPVIDDIVDSDKLNAEPIAVSAEGKVIGVTITGAQNGQRTTIVDGKFVKPPTDWAKTHFGIEVRNMDGKVTRFLTTATMLNRLFPDWKLEIGETTQKTIETNLFGQYVRANGNHFVRSIGGKLCMYNQATDNSAPAPDVRKPVKGDGTHLVDLVIDKSGETKQVYDRKFNINQSEAIDMYNLETARLVAIESAKAAARERLISLTLASVKVASASEAYDLALRE